MFYTFCALYTMDYPMACRLHVTTSIGYTGEPYPPLWRDLYKYCDICCRDRTRVNICHILHPPGQADCTTIGGKVIVRVWCSRHDGGRSAGLKNVDHSGVFAYTVLLVL